MINVRFYKWIISSIIPFHPQQGVEGGNVIGVVVEIGFGKMTAFLSQGDKKLTFGKFVQVLL